MRNFTLTIIAGLCLATNAFAAPAIELEIATDTGVQITAPRDWLQLLKTAGIENIRIRGAGPGDTPAVENLGTAERPRYHVVGVLTAREQLLLPGGAFGRGDVRKLRDYFDRLAADGEQRLTAPTSLFGLTDNELRAVLEELTPPIDFSTKGMTSQVIVDRLQASLKTRFAVDGSVNQILRPAGPAADDLNGLARGTGLAILLRTHGLVLRPEKQRGQPVVYRIASQIADGRAGKLNDFTRTSWPIGWETEKSPGEIAPSLFEQLNVEIANFTLEETLGAIGPRLKLPYFLDHHALAAMKLDPKTTQVRVDKGRMSYKRLLDRVAAQARMGCDVRVDEAGAVFVWIGR
jgi:hypothetical protein